MKRIFKITVCAAIALSMTACEDIIEKDISDDMVQATSPTNNQAVTSNVVSFQWNKLDGADQYRIQVYNSGSAIVLDSLVNAAQLSYPLNAGNYQWRIRGENSAYNSEYNFNNSFSVVETSDLASQQVILSGPSDNVYTNATSMVLDWQDLSMADSYSFELINVTSGNLLVSQQAGITGSSLALNNSLLQGEAQYMWKVKAVNATSATAFSSRKFFVDRTVPNTPQLSAPLSNATFNTSQTIQFSWNMAADPGIVQSAVSYNIEFSTTAAFNSILQSSQVDNTSYQQSFSAAGDYYWRVRAKDAAGNQGGTTGIYKITVN